jgi:hypothetical protein
MSLTIVLIGIAALLFVYAAVKGKDPRDIIKQALSHTAQAGK